MTNLRSHRSAASSPKAGIRLLLRRLRRVASIVLVCTSAVADEVPLANNVGFEEWTVDRTQPVGWRVSTDAGFRTSADCGVAVEGSRSLRIEGLPTRAKGRFGSVAQVVSGPRVHGHALVLTGAIRTESVEDGYAGYWMRVDAVRGKRLQFDNMIDRGARGTTGWRRFRISLPVAPNAGRIVFGALLTGTGKAWFDDVCVEVDTSVDIAAVDTPELEPPPRPTPSPLLADDGALALSEAAMPAVDPVVRDDVRTRSHAVRSLFSDDDADLAFLGPVLAGRRVVELGESAHGVAEFNWIKVRLVKFLHERMGYDVIAFESSLADCAIADAELGVQPPLQVMKDCIFATWHTSEVLGLFEYLDATRRTGKPMMLAGFDSQSSGAAQDRSSQQLRALVARVDGPLAERLGGDDAMLVRWYRSEDRSTKAREEMDAPLADYESAERVLRARRSRLERMPAFSKAAIDLAIQETIARRALIGQLAASSGDAIAIRDRAMADNLDFLLDTRYPGRKVVVWAHNFHIARSQLDPSAPPSMGTLVARRRGAEVYALGVFMGRGVAAWNDRTLYPIAAPPPDTVEGVLANAGRAMSFVDMNAANGSAPAWARDEMSTRDWGVHRIPIVPAAAYDGLLYIDTVTPPDYLR